MDIDKRFFLATRQLFKTSGHHGIIIQLNNVFDLPLYFQLNASNSVLSSY